MNRIKIDLDRKSGDISRGIFGGHIEHNKRRVYGGIYDPRSPQADEGGLREDVKQALIELGITNIRYPGGNFVSAYRWRDGVGPREQRPVRHNVAWNTIETNEFGTDEFIAFCRKVHSDPYFCVNCGDGDMREAADWVDYCNSRTDTEMAKLRARNGSPESYGIVHWGIGNEVDSPTQIGTKTPYEYARAATEFGKLMKRIDPSIRIIAAGVRTWEDHPRVLARELGDEKSEWVERGQLILEMAGPYVDYIALHRYIYPRLTESFESCMLGPRAVEEHLTAYEGLIKAVSLNRGLTHPIRIAFDEWGAEPRFDHDDLEGALATAMYLNTFIRHSDVVRIANFNPMMRSFMPVQPDRDFAEVFRQTIYHSFRLYSSTCGPQSLDVHWDGDTFSGIYMGHSFDSVRTLDVSGTVNVATGHLVLYVVNSSPEKTIDTNISLSDGRFNGNLFVHTLNGKDPSSCISSDNPDGVVVTKTNHEVSGRQFTYSFEPHSLTVIEASVI